MAVLIPRIRTINVRLSEEEYLELERFCAASGARSLSDQVRIAVHRLVAGTHQKSASASSERERIRVKDLENKLEMLAAELAVLKSGMQPHIRDGAGGSGELRDSGRRVGELSNLDAEDSSSVTGNKRLPANAK